MCQKNDSGQSKIEFSASDVINALLHSKQTEHHYATQESVDNLKERMNEKFADIDKRFEQVDKRFELVDKRFEQVDKRFEQVDKRFDQMDRKIWGLAMLIIGLAFKSEIFSLIFK